MKRLLALAVTVALAACSSGNFAGTSSSRLTPQTIPICGPIYSCTGGGGGGGQIPRVAFSSTFTQINPTSGAVNVIVNGSPTMNLTGQYNTNSATYSAPIFGNQPTTFTTLRPDQVQFGNNALPNGNMYVDPTTYNVTANVVGVDGTKYQITATPNSSGGYLLTIAASNGESWSQNVVPPSGGTQSHNRLRVMKTITSGDVENYFGGVGGVATGIAAVAAVTGAEPVAVVAGGVAGICEAVAGTAMLWDWYHQLGN